MGVRYAEGVRGDCDVIYFHLIDFFFFFFLVRREKERKKGKDAKDQKNRSIFSDFLFHSFLKHDLDIEHTKRAKKIVI